MKKIFFILSVIAITFSSCIDWGLEELPVYKETKILEFNLEHRYVVENANGHEMLAVVTLGTTTNIDTINNTVTVDASIPAPFGSFTQDERRNVSLESIVAYAKLSPAAKIHPMDNAPELGAPGNFTQEGKYQVTAADGKTSRIWTIKVNPLPLINQFEGEYHATGYFDHPTASRDMDLTKYYSSVDATTITGDHSDLGGAGYTVTIKVNADNSVVVKQFANGAEIGEMVPDTENSYNPATKTFTLNYRYMGGNGWRTVSETLVLN